MFDTQVSTSDSFARVAMVARALTGRLDISEIVEIVVHQGMAGLGSNGAVFTSLQPTGVIVPVGAVGYPPAAMNAMGPMRIERLLPITTAAREKTAVYVPNLADGIARFPDLERSRSKSVAWAAIPAMVNGEVLGVFGVSFLREHEFSSADRMFLETLVDVSAAAIACRLTTDDLRPPVVDVRGVVLRVVSTFPALTHRIRATSDGPAASARVDPDKVAAVVDHLIANAVRHTPPGGTVHVRCAVQRSVVSITVDDEGPGVSPDRRRSIFEPTRAEGVSSGLAQARQLARSDGGNLVCDESPHQGARFTLSYPADR